MIETSTLPASIRQRLELAQTLSDDNRPRDAQAVFAEACVELAKTAPELCGVLVSSAVGKNGFFVKKREVTESVERIEYRVFGFLVQEDWKPIRTVRTTDIVGGLL